MGAEESDPAEFMQGMEQLGQMFDQCSAAAAPPGVKADNGYSPGANDVGNLKKGFLSTDQSKQQVEAQSAQQGQLAAPAYSLEQFGEEEDLDAVLQIKIELPELSS